MARRKKVAARQQRLRASQNELIQGRRRMEATINIRKLLRADLINQYRSRKTETNREIEPELLELAQQINIIQPEEGNANSLGSALSRIATLSQIQTLPDQITIQKIIPRIIDIMKYCTTQVSDLILFQELMRPILQILTNIFSNPQTKNEAQTIIDYGVPVISRFFSASRSLSDETVDLLCLIFDQSEEWLHLFWNFIPQSSLQIDFNSSIQDCRIRADTNHSLLCVLIRF